MLLATVGFATDELLAAAAVASMGVLLFAWFAVVRRAALALSLPLAFAAGNVIVFSCFNVLYVKFTSLPAGSHHELTAWLSALLVWCTAMGAISVHAILGEEVVAASVTDVLRSWQTLAVFGLLFAVLTGTSLANVGLDARWDFAGREGFGIQYLIGGIGAVQHTVFFLLGTRVSGRLSSPANLLILGLVAVLAIGQGLTGGREYSIYMIALVVTGAAVGGLSRRALATLSICAVAFGIVFVSVVGKARTQRGFAFGSVADRIETMQTATQNTGGNGASGDDDFEQFVSRVYEFPAQDVIDRTALTRSYAQFEHFDRLRHLFVPLALAPEKLALDDGAEILVRDYGYQLSEYTSVPITSLGDAYRRGGELWVAVVGLCVGAVLRLLVHLTLRLVGQAFGFACVVLLSVTWFRAYTASVLALISLVTYTWTKQVLLFIVLATMVKLLRAVSEREPQRAGISPPPPLR